MILAQQNYTITRFPFLSGISERYWARMTNWDDTSAALEITRAFSDAERASAADDKPQEGKRLCESFGLHEGRSAQGNLFPYRGNPF